MQTQLTQTAAQRQQVQSPQQSRDLGNGRMAGGLARSAAAATELPFSALFYWVD